jgi:hypothetical protein
VIAKGGEVKNVLPPDMEVLWPLIRGKLNKEKIPPYPPKKLTKKDIGGSSARIPPQDVKKSTTGRPTPSGKRKPRSVGEASSGFLSSDQ